jgi:hypothetical protein
LSVNDLVNDIRREIDQILRQIDWAEEEIASTQRRYPACADRLWQSFTLLAPTDPLMDVEATYRAHCREVLERVAHGEDTQPGTAAECCIALCEISLRTPLNTSAAGLYTRMWRLAGMPSDHLSQVSEHYEALNGPQIDDYERMLRRKLRQPWRVLSTERETPSTATRSAIPDTTGRR